MSFISVNGKVGLVVVEAFVGILGLVLFETMVTSSAFSSGSFSCVSQQEPVSGFSTLTLMDFRPFGSEGSVT